MLLSGGPSRLVRILEGRVIANGVSHLLEQPACRKDPAGGLSGCVRVCIPSRYNVMDQGSVFLSLMLSRVRKMQVPFLHQSPAREHRHRFQRHLDISGRLQTYSIEFPVSILDIDLAI